MSDPTDPAVTPEQLPDPVVPATPQPGSSLPLGTSPSLQPPPPPPLPQTPPSS